MPLDFCLQPFIMKTVITTIFGKQCKADCAEERSVGWLHGSIAGSGIRFCNFL